LEIAIYVTSTLFVLVVIANLINFSSMDTVLKNTKYLAIYLICHQLDLAVMNFESQIKIRKYSKNPMILLENKK
jgi:hypothetical protein